MKNKIKKLEEIVIDDIASTKEKFDDWIPGESVPRYVVVRDGLRVSDKDYLKSDEDSVIAERDYWQKVVNKWPDGTKVEIVQYDKKIHRIW